MRRLGLVLALAALGLQGCAGIIEFRMPKEFKGKKQKEDPPLAMALPAQARPC